MPTTRAVDLDRTDTCPVHDTCDRCGAGEGLAVETAGSRLGVHCVTLCATCSDRGTLPSAPPVVVVACLVIEHCEHLGITLDDMAALIG